MGMGPNAHVAEDSALLGGVNTSQPGAEPSMQSSKKKTHHLDAAATLAAAKSGMSVKMHRDALGHIVMYDAKGLSQFGVCYMFKGTFLGSRFVWHQAVVLICLQIGLAILCVLSWSDPKEIPTDVISKCATITNALVGFLLSLFVRMSVRRWWTMREQCLGGLFAAFDQVNLLLCMYHRSDSAYDKWLLETFARYSLACHELVYVVAERDGDCMLPHEYVLTDLVDNGQITDKELAKLTHVKFKAMLVWAWCASLLTDYAILPPSATRQMTDAVERGRGAIQGIFTYVETLLPMTYIHIVIFIVKFTVLLLALQAGMVSGKAYANGEINRIVVQVSQSASQSVSQPEHY